MPVLSRPYANGRSIGFGLVVVLHIGLIYALVNALDHRVVDVARVPIETKIIEAAPPERHEPPPPPPPQFAPPPPLFVPPPEVHIETPPPPRSTAVTAVTQERPVAPAPALTTSVVPQPASVQPRLDAQHSHEPEYPPAARRLGQQGAVILQVLVGVDGRVGEAKLVQSCGFPSLDDAALRGVKDNYRFAPGTVDGKPQPMWHTIKFVWKLT